jgi:hypothetical protein
MPDNFREFRKSSLCGTSACVEVAIEPDRVGVRDSEDPAGPVLSFSPAEWSVFLAGVKAGEFDVR